MRLALALTCLAAPVLADGCPTAPDHSAEMDPLYEALLVAPDETAARMITNQMWGYWDNAPDEASQAMLDEAMRARARFDFLRALDRLDTLVGYCPFYAEGYNQRAFVNFLREDFAAALPDLDRALELNPRHIGALSGKAVTLFALGREEEAQAALRAALAINPWLAERALLKPLPGEEL
ncbi:tetratricopeptide repeat protein [Mameliella sp. CS4]|uniref:tetratricopeptide repeat protein n=1 Tax=Mameliella sp. CS4 TaxID=2862329 RepID=UPI001C5D0E36|nr:tetratricopeptide repeat protein [Mameliella sp. CS4]MBW4982938.1 tetratricopeptide repeat protein [Mameliella sp. CS4]